MNICIIGNHVKMAIEGCYKGGAEKQTALIARELASLNHHVVVIDSFQDTDKTDRINDISFMRPFDMSKGTPGLRFLAYRVPMLYKAALSHKPDVIYTRGTTIYTAFLSYLFRNTSAKFVWGLAANYDLRVEERRSIRKSLYSKLSDNLMFKFASPMLCRFSSAIICQTKEQLNFVQTRYRGKKCYLVSNICDVSKQKSSGIQTQKQICLWVGKFSGNKGEESFLRLSERLPHVQFAAAGQVTDEFRKNEIYEQIKRRPNIDCLGRLPHSDLLELYRRASLIVHTSPSEGFSNVFLEAWSFGIPVVSLHVNPDGLLTEYKLGRFSGGCIDIMAAQIQDLLQDSKTNLLEEIGKKAVRYIQKNHAPSVISKKMESIFCNL